MKETRDFSSSCCQSLNEHTRVTALNLGEIVTSIKNKPSVDFNVKKINVTS